MQRTSTTLPPDCGPRPDHAAIAAQMRNTDAWVHIGDYGTRRTAHNVAYQVRNSKKSGYEGHVYDARARTTDTGTHQVWARWVGPREATR